MLTGLATLLQKSNILTSCVDNKINLNYGDNGRGVAENIKKKIFEPFFTTKRAEGHKGLGLQIITNIVTIRLGGEIDFHSEENNGSKVEMQFALSLD